MLIHILSSSTMTKIVVQCCLAVIILLLQKATGCREACSPIGLDDSNIIPDSSFTASSEYSAFYAPHKARLSSDRCWQPNGNGNASDYLQIDLDKVFVICAVATKGNAKSDVSEWTTEYKISTSMDGNTWITYSDTNSPKLFPGNADRGSAVKHDLGTLLLARFIRFIPTTYMTHKALRVEVYSPDKKVYQNPCSAVGLDDINIIPDSSFTASTKLRDEYGAMKARLSSDHCWEPKDNNNPTDYLQIDLGKVFVICAVATKGNAHSVHSEWTTEYKISTSSDGNLWIPYSEKKSSIKLFLGNTDKNTEVKNDLAIPVLAKLIRFTPTKYKGHKALRVEVYGFHAKDFSCSSLPVGVASVAKIPDNNMTSSSQYNTSTLASYGRLGYTAGSSWCAATSDSSPYLQVKLNSPYIICGIATQGDHQSDNWVQTYEVQTSTDGSSFADYKYNNATQEFGGNTDRDTILKNPLYEGAVSEYVRIKPKSNYGATSCVRTELYGVQQRTVCSQMSIGVSYANLVPDHRFTASSYYAKDASDKRYIASSARLRTNTAWEPATFNQTGDWLQIDLGSVMYVCAVATQGNPYDAYEFAKKYKLRVSLDNLNWEYYKENRVDKVFIGNTERHNIVTNSLSTPTKTKFLRFYPTDLNQYAAMRVDVYGVPTSCSSPFGVEKGGSIDDNKMTSSSQSDSAHAASFGRLYGNASWCSNVQANTEYLQVDLDKMVTLTGIATQGDRTMDKWVKTYTLKYSIDGNTWSEYREGQPSAKEFQGNTDNSSIVVRWFTHPVTVRYVRVFPQTWNNGSCMRIEMFGCSCPSSPKIKSLQNKLLTATPSSYVDLQCNIREPLIPYIDWYSDGTDVTHLSGGINRTESYVKSLLRVNYTNAHTVVRNYKCSNTSLSLSNIVCRKNIVCRAKYVKADSNADSLKSAQVMVNLEKPSALTTPTVGSILSRSAVVNWTQPVLKSSQANIISYVVKYWQKSSTKVIIAASQERSKNISWLSVCTEYNVSITSYSVLGPGPWSDVQTFRTDSEKPTMAPSYVRAQAKTSQSILVTWQVPVGVRCPPIGYTVTYTKTLGGRVKAEFVSGGQTTSKKIENLEKWTGYSITVSALNDKGSSPVSSSVFGRTSEDVPDAQPQNLAAIAKTSTKVEVSWDPPPADKQNGIIRGYKVSYCKTGQCSSPTVKLVTSTNTTLNNLGMFTQYTIKVLAYTSVGDGPYSDAVLVSLKLPPTVPRKVTVAIIPPITTIGPRLKLDWDRPLNPNGLKGYKVFYTKTGNGDPDLITLNATTFTALLPVCGGENYNIQVWAFTDSKEGIKYTQSMSVPSYVPKSPQGLTSVQINTMAYKISWRGVMSTNGTILTYEMSLLSRNGLKLLNNSCSDVPCGSSSLHDCYSVLNDIDKCLKYNISIRAYTKRGPGSFSKPLIIQQKVLGIPQDFNMVSIVKTSVTLEWKIPEDLIIPVKMYTVKYSWQLTHSSCSCTNSSLNGKVVTNSTKITIRDLYPDTEYRFTVSATTECGEGQASVIKVFQTKPAEDARSGEKQESKGCSPTTYVYITLVIIGVLVAVIVLLLVYIQHLRKKVKDFRGKRNYKGKSSQERNVYENTSVDNGRPDESIEMNDITATVSPEYDVIDPLPCHPRKPISIKGRHNSSVRAAPNAPGTSYMNPPLQNSTPSNSKGILNSLVASATNNPQHTIPSSSIKADSNSSFGKESSDVYQPLIEIELAE